METIKKERTHVETYEVYIANDGREFADKEECKKYEKSALAVLLTKYNQLIVDTRTEFSIFEFGNDDTDYNVVQVPNIEAMDTILKLDALCNPHIYECMTDNHKAEQRERHLKEVRRAWEEQDLLFIWRGFEGAPDDFWIHHTRNHYIEMLNSVGKPKEEKKEEEGK